MAIQPTSTPAPAPQPGLLRALAGFLTLPKSRDTPAPTGVVPPHDTLTIVEGVLRQVDAKLAQVAPVSERHIGPLASTALTALLPTPLPSLTSALSRRRAIFGAVVLAAAPVAVQPAHATPALSVNDRRLVELADAYEALDRRCNEHTAAHRYDHTSETDDEFDVLTTGFGPLEEECAVTPADSLVGVIAKARLCLSPTARGCADNERAFSIADDLCRLQAAGGLHV